MSPSDLVVGNRLRPLTDKGLDRRDRLRAVEAYLRAASPAAIPETPLPYAVILGTGEKWLTRLAPAHQRPPSWYSGGANGFTIFLFANSMMRLNTRRSGHLGGWLLRHLFRQRVFRR